MNTYDYFMKKKISVSIDEENMEWIDKKIKERTFASRSHAVNVGINKMKNNE